VGCEHCALPPRLPEVDLSHSGRRVPRRGSSSSGSRSRSRWWQRDWLRPAYGRLRTPRTAPR